MSFLEGMKDLRRKLETPKHPLGEEESHIRYPYLLGVAIFLAQADEEFTDEEREFLEALGWSLDMPDEDTAKVLSLAVKSDPEIFKDILPPLAEPRISKLFIADLKKAAVADERVTASEEEMIAEYEKLLNLYAKGKTLCREREEEKITEQMRLERT